MARTLRDAVPGLGPLSRTRAAQGAIRAARRRKALRSSAAFSANELLGRRGRVSSHELAIGGNAVLRHRTRDVDIFDEILVGDAYKLPPEVLARVAAVPSPRVLDLGGNIGLFALWFLSGFPAASITSVEADPANVPILRACAALNPRARWQIVAAAASTSAGSVMFDSGRFADSAISATGTVRVPTIDVFELVSDADLVKVDIEGSEWPILLDRRFATISSRVLVMEWHAEQAPFDREPQAVAVELVERAGYTTLPSGGPGHGTIWAWK